MASTAKSSHADDTSKEYNIPIKERKRPTDWPRTIAFSLFFNLSIILTHGLQLILSILYPFRLTRPYYEVFVQYTKLAFGRLIIAITQLFAPSKLVISCSDPHGNYVDPETFVSRDKKGNIEQINLPRKSIWMSNHQIYTDWLYLWNLAYYSDLADSIFIILLKLYKWAPIIGPAMQYYRFIFLARKWDTDKQYLARHLSRMARLASDKNTSAESQGAASKLLLLIFPEGTLVSPLTKPASKRYAEKTGIEDCRNMLLPRSTGLLFALRSLAADIDDLKLVDYTIGYPGVPSPGRAQEFFTLRSTFMQGVSPPAVHLHFTILSLNPSAPGAPPLGKLPETAALAAKEESTPEERERFDAWLLSRWREKDDRMSKFYEVGDFLNGTYRSQSQEKHPNQPPFLEIPIRLMHRKEFADVFCCGYIIVIAWVFFKAFYAIKGIIWG